MKSMGSFFFFSLLCCLMLAAIYAVFQVAPAERTMGDVQRIFYFHVSAAWTSLFFFFVVFLTSLGYLFRRQGAWDDAAYSAAEIGFLFCSLVLLTGPLWAKPVWGAWWTWDPRLTTTFIMWALYGAYLLLRQGMAGGEKQATFAAVYGLFAFLNVPLVMVSIRWWRGIHPQVIGPGGAGLDPLMAKVLALSALAVGVLAATLFYLSFQLRQGMRRATQCEYETTKGETM